MTRTERRARSVSQTVDSEQIHPAVSPGLAIAPNCAAPRRRLLRTLVILALLAFFALGARTALAHATLVRSDPPSNARLSAAPKTVNVWFSEDLEPRLSTLSVVNSAGQAVSEGSPGFDADPTHMSVALGELKPDVYSVLWTAASRIDGHTLQGSFPFLVLNPDGTAPSARPFAEEGTSGGSPSVLDVVWRWLLLAGVAGVLGASLLAMLGAAPPPRFWLAAGVLAIVAADAAFIAYLVEGRGSGLDVLLGTREGKLTVAEDALAAVAGILAILGDRRRVPRYLALVPALAVGPVLALSSHAAGGEGAGWGTIALSAHTVAALAWPGALVGLVALHRSRLLTPATFERFSNLALAAAAVVLAAGVFVAAMQITNSDGLFHSDYGKDLIVKIVLATVALLFAGLNTLVYRRRPEDRFLSRGLVAEAVVLAVVLLAAGRLSQIPSPASSQSAQGQAGTGFERTLGAGDLNGTLAVVPNSVGVNKFAMALSRADGGDVGDVLQVRLRFTYNDPSVGVSQVILNPIGKNRFSAEGSFLSLAGSWQVEAGIRRRGQDDLSITYPVDVPPPMVQATGGTWDWPIEAFGSMQFLMGLLGAAGLALVLARLRWGVSVRALWSRNVLAGLLLAVWGFGFAFIARETQAVNYTTLANPVAASDASITRGQALYQQNCASCHGAGGKGDGPIAPTLNPRPFDLTVHVPLHPDGQIFGWMTDGVPRTAMPAWKDALSEEDRWNIVNYLRTLTQ